MSEQYTWIRFSLLLVVVVSVLGGGVVASTSSNLSPATASAQSQAQTQTGNQTSATVELDNSSATTATTIAISQVNLPEGGFVAIHDEAYTSGVVHGSEITVSKYLDSGTHENVQVPVNRSVPGGNNVSQLNATQANLTAVIYRDTNDNQQFDFSKSFGETDEAYQKNETTAVSDTEFVALEENKQIAQQRSQSAPASLQFNSQRLRQTSNGQQLTLDRANLSEGGFIAVHDQRYLPPTNNPLSSTIGLSRYLEAGTHQNITIRVTDGAINRTQTVVAIPYQDTNGNERFDYVESGGEADYAYLSQKSGTATIINQTAQVRVSGASRSPAPATSSLSESTATPRDSNQGVVATEAERGTSAASPTATNAASGVQSDGEGILGGNFWYLVVGGIIVLIAVVVIWGFERRS